MTKPFLLLYRGGPVSQLQPVERAQAQSFDIALSWDGEQAPQVPGAAFVHAAPGLRWQGLMQTLAAQAETLARYSHVWLPDEGLRWTSEDISRLFAVCVQVGLDLAQPAFTAAAAVAPIARRHAGFQLRFTNAVDAAAPVLSRRLLGPALAALQRGDGASTWPCLAAPGRVAVVDAVEVDPGSAPVAAETEGSFNLGGLLDSGDSLCFGERGADGDALIDAVAAACAAFGLSGAALARYLASHLVASANTQAMLERELASAGIEFNRVLSAAPRVVPSAPAPIGDGCGADLARRLALCEADLRELRARHRALVDERERQDTLLATLAERLRPMRPGIVPAARAETRQ